MKTAREVVEIYLHTIWDENQPELVREYCADPITRHDANNVRRLSHDEQIARIKTLYAQIEPRFVDVVLSGDEEHVTTVWNATGKDPKWRQCGIEVFRVQNGRITDVWNSTYMDGAWGE